MLTEHSYSCCVLDVLISQLMCTQLTHHALLCIVIYVSRSSSSPSHLIDKYCVVLSHQLTQLLHLAVQTILLYHASCSPVEFVVESAEKPNPLLTLVEVKGWTCRVYTLVPLVRPLVACELGCVLFPLCTVSILPQVVQLQALRQVAPVRSSPSLGGTLVNDGVCVIHHDRSDGVVEKSRQQRALSTAKSKSDSAARRGRGWSRQRAISLHKVVQYSE
jgi:hypothetical protein